MTEQVPPKLDPDDLTEKLRKAGMLEGGKVVGARSVHSFSTVLSKLHRLKIDYEGGQGPRHLYLKTDLPGRPAKEWDSGPREVAFYTTVAPAMAPGLLPRCVEASVASDGSWHLLLEDLTDTHFIATQWPVPPTLAQSEAIVRCRARFYAAWWDHPRLGADIGAWPTDAEGRARMEDLAKQYVAFADALGDRLPPERRMLYEKIIAQAGPLSERFRSRRNITLIQGDSHSWNCFLAKDGVQDTARLFDWDGWRIAVAAEDLAYMMAMHWFPDLRQRSEDKLLDAFHDELLAGGVTGYDRRALQDDYRLAVLWQTTRPIWMRSAGIPGVIWWHHLERIHLAAEDLGCRELLD